MTALMFAFLFGIGIQTHAPERIVIPAIELNSPVFSVGWSTTLDSNGKKVSSWDVAEYTVGWHKTSAKLGQGGNVVLSGHQDIYGSVFRELDELKVGDDIDLWAGDKQYRYVVDEITVVLERGVSMEQRIENGKWIGEFDDDRLTLVTCWPRDDNSHRLIVVAKRIAR